MIRATVRPAARLRLPRAMAPRSMPVSTSRWSIACWRKAGIRNCRYPAAQPLADQKRTRYLAGNVATNRRGYVSRV